jgi:hypothetical protein
MCRRSQSSGPSIPQFAHVHNRRGDAVTVHSRAFFARFVPLMCVDETLVLLALATGRFRGSAGSKSRVSARARSPKISLLPIAGGGICGPNKARRRPRRKVQRINVSTRPVRNAETIGIWLLSQSPWTLRARGAARDRRPGSRTATGRGKAAHYAIILLSPVWVSNTRLRGRPSSFDVVSKRLPLHAARARPCPPVGRDPRVVVYCAYRLPFY